MIQKTADEKRKGVQAERKGRRDGHNIRHSSLQSQSRESLSVEPRFLDP